jgi:hypothetical protein
LLVKVDHPRPPLLHHGLAQEPAHVRVGAELAHEHTLDHDQITLEAHLPAVYEHGFIAR